MDFKELIDSFAIYGDFQEALPYGNGHINQTYRVVCHQAGRPMAYLLQRINENVFPQPQELMENVERICHHLQQRAKAEGMADLSRRVLSLVPTKQGKSWVKDDEGGIWRCYLFIEGASGHEVVQNPQQAREAGRCFAEYQRLLADLPGRPLKETIQNFHETPLRYARLVEAAQAAPASRLADVAAELDYFRSHEQTVRLLTGLRDAGELPVRVVHNDTKLNNILIDDATDQGLCVIDLDTSMPGLSLYDFGDLVRTSTSPVPEDHPHPQEVNMDFSMFKALADGFLENGRAFMNEQEILHLPEGGLLMTMEVGIRFLTDYLEGNKYFKVAYPEHNLVRCRTQVALCQSIEQQMTAMKDTVQRLAEVRV
ncbi:MAG: aminoglycoside phosphotransferase family protein [Spirochaetales bacterium]|nr:aminoglycoside phosphotransferase family protein [Spirochaetales bacterium]